MVFRTKGNMLWCVLISTFFTVLFYLTTVSGRENAPGSDGILSTDNEMPGEISARALSYAEKKGLYIAEGDVLITRGGLSLTAQKAVYNNETGIAEVYGDIRLEMGTNFLTGEKGVFNLEGQTGRITRGSLFLSENHFYISSDVMEKTGVDSYLMKDFHLTTCDGPHPDWSITGSEAGVTVDGYGSVKNAVFRIHDVPLMYIPYMIFPAKTTRQSGLLLPQMGQSDRNGIEVEVPFFWAISDQADATFYERYMSRRGLMQGLEFRYAGKNNSEGTFLLDFLSDHNGEKDLNDPEQLEISPFERTNRERYWLRGRAEQEFPYNIKARLDMDVVSDQDYLREFDYDLSGYQARPDLAESSGRPVDDTHSSTRRSVLRVSRDSRDYSLQAVASYYQRPEGFINDTTSQPLTGIGFTYLPKSSGKAFPPSFSLDADYDYIWRDYGQRGHSLSFNPEITCPVRLGDFLEFEPSAGFIRDMQWVDNGADNSGTQSIDTYDFKARFSTILARTFDPEWPRVARLRHKITPSLIYEYRRMNDREYEPWFESSDSLENSNLITFSIKNDIYVRKHDKEGNMTSGRWADFSLSQGYDIDEARNNKVPGQEREPFEPLLGNLSLTPSPILDLDLEAAWDHYKRKVSSVDLSLELNMNRSGGRRDIYEVDYVYLDEGNKGFSYYVDLNLVHGFSAGSRLQRDMDRGYNIEKGYWLGYRSQCWEVYVAMERLDKESRFMLTFNLLGFGR